MSRLPSNSMNFSKLSTVIALALVASIATPAFATAPPARRNVWRATHAAQRFMKQTHSVAMGTFVDGPKHTWDAVREKPVSMGLKLLAVGVAGGMMKKLGIEPGPFAIAASAGSLVIQVWMTRGDVATADNRLRSIGANYVWPGVLGVTTTVAGEMIGHGSAHAAGSAHSVSTFDVLKSGAQTLLIASDVPAVLQTAFRSRPKPAQHD